MESINKHAFGANVISEHLMQPTGSLCCCPNLDVRAGVPAVKATHMLDLDTVKLYQLAEKASCIDPLAKWATAMAL